MQRDPGCNAPADHSTTRGGVRKPCRRCVVEQRDHTAPLPTKQDASQLSCDVGAFAQWALSAKYMPHCQPAHPTQCPMRAHLMSRQDRPYSGGHPCHDVEPDLVTPVAPGPHTHQQTSAEGIHCRAARDTHPLEGPFGAIRRAQPCTLVQCAPATPQAQP